MTEIIRPNGSQEFVNAICRLLKPLVGEKIEHANEYGVRVMWNPKRLGELTFLFLCKAGGLVRTDCDLNQLTGKLRDDREYIDMLIQNTLDAIARYEHDRQQRSKLYLESAAH